MTPEAQASALIRIANRADASALSALAAATFPLACPPESTAADIAAFIAEVLSESRFDEYLADPARTILVAEADEMIGYVMLIDGEPSDAAVAVAATLRPTVEISKLYVLPGNHGGGIATQLMSVALDHARRLEARAAWLGVNQRNERAQKFYRKNGFEIVGTKTFWVGRQQHDDYVMERAL